MLEVSCEELTAVIEATANTNYRFMQWQDGNTENPRTVTVTEDVVYTAEFEAYYTITTLSHNEEMGSVEGGGSYAHNSEVVLTAVPNEDYKFVCWLENGIVASLSSSYTFTATKDRTLSAFFALQEPTEEEITITTDSSSATIAWKVVEEADKYILIIYKDAEHTEVVCILEFDENGKLLSINHEKSTKLEGFSFTIDDLTEETAYYYSITTYNSNEEVIDIKVGDFETTTGETVGIATPTEQNTLSIYPNPTTGIVNIATQGNPEMKIYNVYGQLVRIAYGTTVNLSDLANGVYILQVDGKRVKIIRRGE